MKVAFARMKVAFARMKAAFARMKVAFARMKVTLARINVTLARMKVASAQMKATSVAIKQSHPFGVSTDQRVPLQGGGLSGARRLPRPEASIPMGGFKVQIHYPFRQPIALRRAGGPEQPYLALNLKIS